jgi:hypothetical protein
MNGYSVFLSLNSNLHGHFLSFSLSWKFQLFDKLEEMDRQKCMNFCPLVDEDDAFTLPMTQVVHSS